MGTLCGCLGVQVLCFQELAVWCYNSGEAHRNRAQAHRFGASSKKCYDIVDVFKVRAVSRVCSLLR